ncbi:MAG: LamG domain-containing protein [Verrucomicrobiota bacterium]
MMMKPLMLWVALLEIPALAGEFVAYHTRVVTPAATVYADKYQDLVVTFANTANRLEFLQAKNYLPQWKITTDTGGVVYHNIQNLFPGNDADPYCYYSYVRLIESTPDKIVVHWRHFKDIEALTMSKQLAIPDSLTPHGITGVVHELFTIHPDGSVEREVRDASNTRYEDWIDTRLVTRQKLALTPTGVSHSALTPGLKPPFLPRAAVAGNPVKACFVQPAPLYHWTFDEGMKPHNDEVKESVSHRPCEISGLMTRFKKGVSGTALALDGYYAGVSMDAPPISLSAITVAAWVALDAYPYNSAPLVHQSLGLSGTDISDGWYLGIDASGKPFATFKGDVAKTAQSAEVLPLYEWTYVCATLGNGNIKLYVNGVLQKTTAYTPAHMPVHPPATPLLIGRNNVMQKATGLVRTKPKQQKRSLAFIYGLQGLLDEVSVYNAELNAGQVMAAYHSLLPAQRTSDLAKGVLPGNSGTAARFGAAYQSLAFSEVWDPLWRDLPGTEIVVKFDKNPCSVVYWRGTNYAPNWVSENNRWMADQSSEGGSGIADEVGCSEHMADKQTRHCRARIIENTPARVLIHWRYPCVGVSYINLKPMEWSDEYHTIYPDGTGVRKVYWNKNPNSGPGFQDIQFLTNPGELPLDVMDLQALTVMDPEGASADLTWRSATPTVPANPLKGALVELCNSKGSVHKLYAMFQGGRIGPWGSGEQSSSIAKTFAGPWNHWPMSLCPSDGRFAAANDRVTHFALAANDGAKNSDAMSLVLYGFSNKTGFSAGDGKSANENQIKSLLPLYMSWKQPPGISALSGCTVSAYEKETREFPIVATQSAMAVRIAASAASPLVNPCFTVKKWGHSHRATIAIAGATDIRQGTIVDRDATRTLVIWAELRATSPVEVRISGANLPN